MKSSLVGTAYPPQTLGDPCLISNQAADITLVVASIVGLALVIIRFRMEKVR